MLQAKTEVLWRANPGPQSLFLSSVADEALYGGAAGGGKSAALLAVPLRWIHNPRYRALYLRRESAYLGEAIDKSEQLYPLVGGKLVRSPRIEWTFPSGATIWFNHCEHEKHVKNYDSFEFNTVLFDELTHFTEKQFVGISARLRSSDRSLPTIARGATNPGGEGHEWVFKRFGAWLDPLHPHRAAPGERRWYLSEDEVPRGTPDASSRTFVPALLTDNPYITAEYRAKLLQLDPVRRAQLLGGDWLKKPSPKDYWDRSRITHRAGPPLAHDVVSRVRCWDLASTVDGDWTVGAKGSLLKSGLVLIEHIVRFRGTPNDVHAKFATIAAQDKEHDPRCVQWIPEDPGQAGKDQVRSFQNENAGIAIRARRPNGDKLARFGPASARALAGNLEVLVGAWNDDLHTELEDMPFGKYDDQADAVADLVAVLTDAPPASLDSVRGAAARMPRPRM